MKKIRPKIRGWCWTELATVFGWVAEDDGYVEAHKIRGELRSLGNAIDMCSRDGSGVLKLSRTEKTHLKNVRKFVDLTAVKSHHTCGPVIRGIAAIKDDATFLTYTELLLEHLWT